MHIKNQIRQSVSESVLLSVYDLVLSSSEASHVHASDSLRLRVHEMARELRKQMAMRSSPEVID